MFSYDVMMKKAKIPIALGLFYVLFALAFPSVQETDVLAEEASVWYLYNCGFAVKTQSVLMIFDYWEITDPPENPSLHNGYVIPDEIKTEKVVVFISHGHGDHYDKKILAWRDVVPDITYVFGWPNEDIPGSITFDSQRTSKQTGSISIKNIHHKFDGIPESAFLIEVDGLTIYFSGDHGNGPRALNPVYKDNIDYISSEAPQIDLAFLSIFGSPSYMGELYAVKMFSPKVMIPMHLGDREAQAKEFVDRASSQFRRILFWYPSKQGDGFHFSDGRISSLVPSLL